MAKRSSKAKGNLITQWSVYTAIQAQAGAAACIPVALPSLHELLYSKACRLLAAAKDKPKAKTSSKRKAGDSEKYEYVAYRFLGKPSPGQEQLLKQNTGAARWLWNRLKADNDEHYRIMGYALKNTPADYKDLDEYPWLKEADSYALCNVQLKFEKAMSDWLSGEKGRPGFKKKHCCTESYTTNKDSRSNNIALRGSLLTLPKIPGQIRLSLHRKVKPGGTVKSVTVVHEPDGRWYFSILVEYPGKDNKPSPGIKEFFETGSLGLLRHTGLDMSLPYLYVDPSGQQPFYIVNGVAVRFTKAYRRLEKKISREQRRLSRMCKDSNNYRKQCIKIAKLHAKAKHQRTDFLRQMAVRLARSFDVISIEDLDMAAMKTAFKFGKSVSDNGWGLFVRFLEEKCLQYGSVLIRVGRWFPSSRKCSHCGHIHKELKLSDRIYICPECGHVMDRDEQAARNIDQEGLRLFLEALKPGAAMPVKTKTKQPTGGTPGIGCYNYGVHTKPVTAGNVPKMSPAYAAIKEKGKSA